MCMYIHVRCTDQAHRLSAGVYLCMYVCQSVCMYVTQYVCMYVCMYVTQYVCIYVCHTQYVCMYVSMYVHIRCIDQTEFHVYVRVSLSRMVYVYKEFAYVCMYVCMYVPVICRV